VTQSVPAPPPPNVRSPGESDVETELAPHVSLMVMNGPDSDAVASEPAGA